LDFEIITIDLTFRSLVHKCQIAALALALSFS